VAQKVQIQYTPGGNYYSYLWDGDEPLRLGDRVERPATAIDVEAGRYGPQVSVIVGVGEGGWDGPCQHIIRKLDEGEEKLDEGEEKLDEGEEKLDEGEEKQSTPPPGLFQEPKWTFAPMRSNQYQWGSWNTASGTATNWVRSDHVHVHHDSHEAKKGGPFKPDVTVPVPDEVF
jgi:hypothetical protein